MLKPNIGRDVGRSETSACTGGSVKDTTSGVSNLFSLKQQEQKMENINPWGLLGKLLAIYIHWNAIYLIQ